MSNIFVLDWNSNQCLARTQQEPLLRCGSHKLNLAVRLWIDEEPGLAAFHSKVSDVMKKVSTLKVASKLCTLTHYSAVQENAARWSLTYQMVSRFLKIQQHLSAIDDLLAIFATLIEMDILGRAHLVMKKFNVVVTVMLQKENISFLRVREIFCTSRLSKVWQASSNWCQYCSKSCFSKGCCLDQ